MNTARLAELNPLAFSRTAMAPPTLLIAKFSVVLLATGGVFFQTATQAAPLLSQARWAGPGGAGHPVLSLAFVAAGLALLLNRGVRIAAAVAGLSALLCLAGSLAAYSAHAVLAALMLVLGALHGKRDRPVLIRWLVLVLLGSGVIQRILDPLWLSGARVGDWLLSGLAHPLLGWLHGVLPGDAFASALALLVLACEAGLFAGLMVGHVRRGVVWALLAFQVALNLCFASEAMGAWSIALGVAALAYLEWPEGAIRVHWPRACGFPVWLHMALDRLDFDGRLDWPFPEDPDADLEVALDGRRHTDSRALSALLLHFPVFLVLVFATLWMIHLALPPAVSAFLLGLLAAPALTFFALRRIHRVRARLRPSSSGS